MTRKWTIFSLWHLHLYPIDHNQTSRDRFGFHWIIIQPSINLLFLYCSMNKGDANKIRADHHLYITSRLFYTHINLFSSYYIKNKGGVEKVQSWIASRVILIMDPFYKSWISVPKAFNFHRILLLFFYFLGEEK